MTLFFSKLISEPELFLQGTIHPGESIKVFIYGVVGVDGSFGNVAAASIPRDPAILKLVEDAVRKRRYSPARCGPKAVASESYIELEISSSGLYYRPITLLNVEPDSGLSQDAGRFMERRRFSLYGL